MALPINPTQCVACKDGVEQPFPFSMAFQPIVDVEAGTVFAYEALVRGPRGESAGSVLGQVTEQNRYAFDQNCRVRAISLAAQLGLAKTGARLSINFIPGAVYSPAACIQLTLRTAREFNFPLNRLIFEITEGEEVRDRTHLRNIVDEYRRHGFKMALDDFGAGYCGLNLLADFSAEIIKLDMELTRNLHQRPIALAIVRSMAELGKTLGSQIVAEGVETVDEYDAIRDCGIHLMQGYLLAKPAFEALPGFSLPDAVLATTPAAIPASASR
jgi:EAL domain-containing protein (putative c-di-GMP-specific phosphodiesterase class I)